MTLTSPPTTTLSRSLLLRITAVVVLCLGVFGTSFYLLVVNRPSTGSPEASCHEACRASRGPAGQSPRGRVTAQGGLRLGGRRTPSDRRRTRLQRLADAAARQ